MHTWFDAQLDQQNLGRYLGLIVSNKIGDIFSNFVAFSDYLNFKNDAINVILGLAFKTGSISMAIKLSRAILRVVGFGAVA